MSRKFTYRKRNHNYYAPFIYHIILNKAPNCQPFSFLAGDCRIKPGERGSAYVIYSDLGKMIARGLEMWIEEFPLFDIWQYKIMPDHIHLLINRKKHSQKHLSFYIGILKITIRNQINLLPGMNFTTPEIFEENFSDKPIFRKRNLDVVFKYIQENPHRLSMRIHHPEFFTRKKKLQIGDEEIEGYGNFFLLKNPDKLEVHVRRSFSPEEKERYKQGRISEAKRGSVLVSPFISQEEKRIREEVEAAGGRIILIRHEEFGERYKPSGEAFRLCSEGRLLILSLRLPQGTPLSRELCQRMNRLAEALCA